MKRTEIEIKLDKVRHLKFGHNALCAMEEVLGGPMTETVLASHRGQRALLYAGLLHEDRRLTLEQAGNFFDDFDPAYIMNRIGDAIKASQPPSTEDGADESPNGPRPVNGSGIDSSNRPVV